MEPITAKVIQQDILSAQQALLVEADGLLNNTSTRLSKAHRLRNVGFALADDVDVIDKSRNASALCELNERYAMKYPGLKFIPTQVMNSVCAKYGLAIADLTRYTGKVPDWALEQIENNNHLTKKGWKNPFKLTRAVGTRVGRNGKRGTIVHKLDGIMDDIIYVMWDDGTEGRYDCGHTTFKLSNVNDEVRFKIAAPQHQIKLTIWEKFENNQIVSMPPDPIVSLEVKGGYIVITAWDEEGRDPRIFNAQNN